MSLTYFGDGAANQGQVYESFNMAALWKLPVVYIIENNKYAMGTSIERSSSQTELHRRGESLGVSGIQVDGMDVVAVKKAGVQAVAQCRKGRGPVLLEMQTYRYRGHSMSDPAGYRSRAEVDEVRQKNDPIDLVRMRLVDAGAADEVSLKTIDKEIRDIINEAAEVAQSSPEPDPAELYTDVHASA